MKAAILGANGQLGSDIDRVFAQHGYETYPMTHSDVEIADVDSVYHAMDAVKPEIVVNTAAMHHVEKCEVEPERAFAVNALGARNLALVARDLGSVLIHISTDYVFDGRKGTPYEESDAPQPLNVYGNSKLAGEYFVRSITDKHYVVRTSALYGTSGCRAKGGRNFVQLMLKLAGERAEVRVVDNEVVSPTSTSELARQLVALSRSDCYGVYHGTAEGSCSWFEFAQAIFLLTRTRTLLAAAVPGEFAAKVARPMYSVLENRALKSKGLNQFRHWQDGLREYLEQLSRNPSLRFEAS